MDERGRVNVSGGRVEADPEVTLAAPRFDEKSVQRAQPAVPLAARARARPFNLLAVCLAAALAGAVAGAAALKLYQRDSAATTNADARPATRLLAETSAPGGTETPRADTAAPAAEAGETAEAETLKAAGVREEAAGDAEAEAAGGTGATGGDAASAPRDEAAALRGALGEWLAATNARDIPRQMSFYDRQVGSFYLARNVSRAAVRAEKSRVFAAASDVDVRAGEPDIRLSPDGRAAVMRFRKRYHIASGDRSRRGEVLQELRWRRTEQGWKIVGERDLRVLQ